ncbi:MAG TPA: prolipoprotein diacylglyceryl transferase [Candidatus Methanoperedens sp.]|nr:prolipoprotein diacylglyceryl transferase [Candidatus Methanoperedens sp.]
MFPILLRLGPFNVFGHEVGPLTLHTYGVLVALGFLVALAIVLRGARRAGLPVEPVLDVAFIAVLAAIVGSRLLYVLFNLREYLAEPLRALKIWEGGLVFHGGLLLALPLCLIAVRRSRLPAWEVADVFAPAIALGQAVGRMGCFAAGCCYGAPWDPPACVTYTHPEALAPLHVNLFPSQLLAAAFGLAVFAALLVYRPRRRAPGQVFWLYLLLAALARLVEDFFRGTEAKLALLPWLSATQTISLVLAAAALAFFVAFGRRRSRLTLPR